MLNLFTIENSYISTLTSDIQEGFRILTGTLNLAIRLSWNGTVIHNKINGIEPIICEKLVREIGGQFKISHAVPVPVLLTVSRSCSIFQAIPFPCHHDSCDTAK